MDFDSDMYDSAKQKSKEGKYLEAACLYLELAENLPSEERSVILLLAAEAHSDAGRYADAIKVCQLAIEANHEAPMAMRTLGRLLIETQRNDEALEVLKRSLAISKAATTCIYISQILMGKECYPEAEKYTEEAVRLAPDFDEAYYNHGRVLSRLGRLEEAISTLKSAIGISPDYAIAYREIGIIQYHQENFYEATQNLKKCLEYLPGDVTSLELLTKMA